MRHGLTSTTPAARAMARHANDANSGWGVSGGGVEYACACGVRTRDHKWMDEHIEEANALYHMMEGVRVKAEGEHE